MKTRRVSTASRVFFLDESDEETEPEIEPQYLSLPSSQILHREGAASSAAAKEDIDQSKVCRTSQQEGEELSSEGVKPIGGLENTLEGVEATGSLSILSESQIDIQREMDVLTTSADTENGKTSPAPELAAGTAVGMGSATVGQSQAGAAKWNVDAGLLVVNNDDFGTVIDQLNSVQ